MMPLISAAISVAFVASAATALGFFDLDFWWELALLVTIMLLDHWLEMRAVGQASSTQSASGASARRGRKGDRQHNVEGVPREPRRERHRSSPLRRAGSGRR